MQPSATGRANFWRENDVNLTTTPRARGFSPPASLFLRKEAPPQPPHPPHSLQRGIHPGWYYRTLPPAPAPSPLGENGDISTLIDRSARGQDAHNQGFSQQSSPPRPTTRPVAAQKTPSPPHPQEELRGLDPSPSLSSPSSYRKPGAAGWAGQVPPAPHQGNTSANPQSVALTIRMAVFCACGSVCR